LIPPGVMMWPFLACGGAWIMAGITAGDRFWPYPSVELRGPSRARAKGRVPAQTLTVVEPEPAVEGRWGICLSGGGVRAAAFSLGAMQEMHQHGMIHGKDRATWLSAVSGGSYLAGAAAMISAGPRIVGEGDTAEVVAADQTRPAFAAGSPEERLLRNRTRYLTHGRGGPLGAGWRYLMGTALNLVLVGLVIYVVFKPMGWIYGWALPHLRADTLQPVACGATTCGATLARFDAPHWLVLTVLGLLAGSLLTGLGWVLARWPEAGNDFLGGASGVLLAAGLLVWLMGIAVPHALEFVRVILPRHGVGAKAAVSTSGQITGRAAAASSQRTIATGSVAAALVSVVTGYGALRAGRATPPTVQSAEKAVQRVASSWAKRFATQHRGLVLNLAAAISGPVLVAGGALLAIAYGASSPPGAGSAGVLRPLLEVGVPLAAVVAIWSLGDLNVWSLHPFYQRRLAASYALRRIKIPQPQEPSPFWVDGEEAEPLREGGVDACLAEIHGPPDDRADFPDLLICAAANIADYGATPTGSNVTSFVFSEREVGGPLVGSVPTDVYARLVDRHAKELTVPNCVAIAGAAFSPSMGKMTRAPLRFLMALLNLRLGVWLPNPRRLDLSRARTDASGNITYRFHARARPVYLLWEMIGRNKLDNRFLYLTDGGHYENLGLVELVRRRCQWIWCIDASGDSIDTFNTLGEALALADSELGVHIDLVPEQEIAPDPDVSAARAKAGKPPLVRSPYCVGRIYYPDGTVGTLVVIKAGVAENSPWEVQSFYERNHQFPCDPTFDQLFTAERFDAYRALGAWSVAEAWTDAGEEFQEFLATRPS
jgi:hypothetical protein